MIPVGDKSGKDVYWVKPSTFDGLHLIWSNVAKPDGVVLFLQGAAGMTSNPNT